MVGQQMEKTSKDAAQCYHFLLAAVVGSQIFKSADTFFTSDAMSLNDLWFLSLSRLNITASVLVIVQPISLSRSRAKFLS